MNPRLAIVLVVAGAMSLAAIVFASVGLSREPEPAGVAGPAARVDLPAESRRFEGALKPDGLRAPDFELRDQDGEPLRMRDLRGGPVIVTFLYTRCDDTCPPQAQQIKGALDRLDADVPVIAVSVKPSEDTPATARHFLAEQGMAGRMDFALGTQEELEPVWKGYAIQPQSPTTEHHAVIALIDKRGMQRVGFPLNYATPRGIAHDVRVLAGE